MSDPKKSPTLFQSLLPILFLIGLLSLNVIIFQSDATYGPNQISLILAAGVAALVAGFIGFQWKVILEGIVKSISSAMSAMLILLLIGSLAGTWLISGIVPAMIYYGLDILNPTIFLFAACTVSAIVSVATGSSWTTAATIGIALVGIGKAMGIHEGVVAGAIISGAYFGDKISPLSDTTNLAPAMAGTDLFTHIRYLSYTTVPSIVITLIVFLIWGFTLDTDGNIDQVPLVQAAIASKFNIHLGLFIVPIIVVAMIVRKIPAIPALLAGTLLGGVFAAVFQPDILHAITDDDSNSMASIYQGIMQALYGEVYIATGNDILDSKRLLKSGGMFGMMNTIWLILCAMIFGGVMESCGMLKRIAHTIIQFAHSTGSLVTSTAGTCFVFNVTASDQYIAIVVPGRMYASTYRERGYAPELLSRTLEDSGTVTSVLIPWNTCGAYQSQVLQVSTLTYLPYCFFNLLSPLMTILFAYLNIKIRRLKPKNEPPLAQA